ncbi:MAG: type II toxin-antitoxin system RelE/ParE family toxin [Planctomycetes bacterium]|nr:type II toxin-antitoxin system RelE/ParE family toxin [Planctomycetota bacterium]
MLSVESHPEADHELEEAALRYERQSPGLGGDFLNELEATLRRILEAPERWACFRGENRRLRFHRFPYAVVYSVKGERVYIKAVAHLHRRPFYWQHRRWRVGPHRLLAHVDEGAGCSASRPPPHALVYTTSNVFISLPSGRVS